MSFVRLEEHLAVVSSNIFSPQMQSNPSIAYKEGAKVPISTCSSPSTSQPLHAHCPVSLLQLLQTANIDHLTSTCLSHNDSLVL